MSYFVTGNNFVIWRRTVFEDAPKTTATGLAMYQLFKKKSILIKMLFLLKYELTDAVKVFIANATEC